MHQLRSMLLIILIVFYPLKTTQAEVYRWIDENGNTHFSDQPHANATRHKITASKPAGIGISNRQLQKQKELLDDFQEKRETQQQQALQQKKRQAITDKNCTTLKNRLRTYQEVDYLYTRDDAGEKQHLSNQQKNKEEQKLRTLIDERC